MSGANGEALSLKLLVLHPNVHLGQGIIQHDDDDEFSPDVIMVMVVGIFSGFSSIHFVGSGLRIVVWVYGNTQVRVMAWVSVVTVRDDYQLSGLVGQAGSRVEVLGSVHSNHTLPYRSVVSCARLTTSPCHLFPSPAEQSI